MMAQIKEDMAYFVNGEQQYPQMPVCVFFYGEQIPADMW